MNLSMEKVIFKMFRLILAIFVMFSCSNADQKDYYEDGTLKYIVETRYGKKEGQSKLFSEDGNLIEVAFWKDGVRDGESVSFYDSGEKRSTATFKKGLLEGNVINFYQNGHIEEIYNYSGGKKLGPFKTYYPNAQLKMEGEVYDLRHSIISSYRYREYTMEGLPKRYLYLNDSVQYDKRFSPSLGVDS